LTEATIDTVVKLREAAQEAKAEAVDEQELEAEIENWRKEYEEAE
jgi:hypothetical protein